MHNKAKRAQRLAIANSLGSHTRSEWAEMKAFFNNTCCICFGKSGLLNVERDHIIPLYQNGTNSISNIQPLCAKCNSSKGPDSTDYRPLLAKHLGKKLPLKYTLNG